MVQQTEEILLQVRNMKMYFPVTSGVIFQKRLGEVKAVDDVSFYIKRGETLGLVGESGSGKTTIGRCILQLLRPTAGEVVFDGLRLVDLNTSGLRGVRRKMQVIFQDPYSSLDPRMTCGDTTRNHAASTTGIFNSGETARSRSTTYLQNNNDR